MRFWGLILIALTAGVVNAQQNMLSTTGPVLDQGRTPTCWAHSWIGYLNHRVRPPGGAASDFSVDHLLYHDLRARALSAIVAAREGREIQFTGGGTAERAFAISREHGILARSAYTPKAPIVNYYRAFLAHVERLAGFSKRVHSDEAYLRRLDRLLERWVGAPPSNACMDSLSGFEQWRYRIESPAGYTRRSVAQATEPKIITRAGELASIENMDFRTCLTKQDLLGFLQRQIREDRPTLLSFNTHNGAGRTVYRYDRGKVPTYRLKLAAQEDYGAGHSLVLVGMDGETLIAEDSRGTDRFGTHHKRLAPNFWREHIYSITEMRRWEERE